MPPAGTKYADYANVHNYIYHPNAPGLEENKTWKVAEPSSACKVDGLFGEYGVTWAPVICRLPRIRAPVAAEGDHGDRHRVDGPVTEEIHALNLLTLYLDQFKRGLERHVRVPAEGPSGRGGQPAIRVLPPD